MTAEDSHDQAAIDAAFDPERRAGPRGPYLERYSRESEEARKTLDCRLDVPYGPNPRESLDIFPSRRPGSPVVMFIHGGYWRALSCKEFSFVARGLVPHDITVAVMNYGLCPQVTIPDISRQSHAAAAFLAQSVSRSAGAPDGIFALGHSAGGQQVGMLLSHNEEPGLLRRSERQPRRSNKYSSSFHLCGSRARGFSDVHLARTFVRPAERKCGEQSAMF